MKIEKKYLEIPIDCIKDLIIEPCLKFTTEGLSIKSFAESNAACCIFDLPKEKFIEYDIVEELKFKISIDMLSKVMKRIKTKNINLSFNDEKIIISGENKKEYSIAVMYDDEVERDLPQLTHNSNFKMECSKLQEMFLDTQIISENIKLETAEGKIKISSGELNKFNHELEHPVVGDAVASYSLEYLNKFMSASKYFKDVLFEFNSDSPCKLTFKNELEIQFILAARCE